MKKWVWVLAFSAVLLLSRLEHTGVEISRLEPVELVRITHEEGNICIETDTGAKGYGQDLNAAVENLHSSSSAAVFLDTADYLLVSDEAEQYIDRLYGLLRPACQVCFANGDINLTEVLPYLKAHSLTSSLLRYRAGDKAIPTLFFRDGRGQIVQRNDSP